MVAGSPLGPKAPDNVSRSDSQRQNYVSRNNVTFKYGGFGLSPARLHQLPLCLWVGGVNLVCAAASVVVPPTGGRREPGVGRANTNGVDAQNTFRFCIASLPSK